MTVCDTKRFSKKFEENLKNARGFLCYKSMNEIVFMKNLTDTMYST